jgi:thiol-disulfide isomerase/thioredoxin
MSRTFLTVSLLFNLIASLHSQRPEAGPAKNEAPAPAPKADVQKARRMGPGVGAYTEDPRKILRAAGRALRAVRSLTYEAEYLGTGAMATHSPVVTGRLSLSRLAPDNPLKARMAARGLYFHSGEGRAMPFHTTFDGKTVRRLRPEERALVIKVLRAGDPAERTLGFVTSFFGGGPYQLMMFEYLSDAPFEGLVEAPVVDYEGRAAVGGVLCHVVYVEHPANPEGQVRRERWYFGVKDSLPRKLEQLVVDDNGRHGAYVLALSRLRPNVSLSGATFTAPLPRGYASRPHRQPERPALLSVGEPAPDWRLSDPAGKMHSLSDYRGKVVVLDFWATWCGPCIRAMPGLQALHERYGGRGAVVFGLNAWEKSNPAEFMKRSGYTYGLLLKGEGVAEAYRVGTLPTLYVIGVDGRIIHRASGIDDGLAGLIEKHLREHGM